MQCDNLPWTLYWSGPAEVLRWSGKAGKIIWKTKDFSTLNASNAVYVALSHPNSSSFRRSCCSLDPTTNFEAKNPAWVFTNFLPDQITKKIIIKQNCENSFCVVFNWGGILQQTLDKEVRPNPLVLAWVSNVLTSPDLYIEFSTDPLASRKFFIWSYM